MDLNKYLEKLGITLAPMRPWPTPLDQFKFITINPMADHGDHYVSMHLDGILIRPIKCTCSSKELFDYGCACGGC